MVRIPFPRSTWSTIKSALSGSLLGLVWGALVTVVLIIIFYILISLGPLGTAIAGLLIASLLSSTVRKAVRDVYARRWAKI